MVKNKLTLLILLFLSVGRGFGQNNTSYFNTTAIVVLLPYNPLSKLPVTDSLGSFTFNVKDRNGEVAAFLWKLDTVSGKWVPSYNAKLIPSAVYGRTDLTAVREHNLIQSFYWKDVAGNYWRLSPIKDEFTPLAILKDIWAGKPIAPQLKASKQKIVWRTLSEVSLAYN